MKKKEFLIDKELDILSELSDVFAITEHEEKEIGKYALLYQHKLQGYFDTKEEAHQAAKRILQCNNDPYLVKQVFRAEK